MQGWISLHRKIMDNPLFTEKRTFSKFEAWVDILLMVNHEDAKFLLGNEMVEVKRGQKITSMRNLCERWNWSNTKVKKFLELLQSEEMITVKSDTKKTVITVEKYGFYQSYDDTKTTPKRHRNDTKTTRKHTNNNDNNELNNDNNDIKKIYGDYVSLSDDEYAKLINKLGKDKTLDMIERLDNYIGQIGVKKANSKYKSHYSVIINWDRRDKEKGAKPIETNRKSNENLYAGYDLGF